MTTTNGKWNDISDDWMLSVHLSVHCTSKHHLKIISNDCEMTWKQKVQQDFKMLAQLELSFRNRTGKQKWTPKAVD